LSLVVGGAVSAQFEHRPPAKAGTQSGFHAQEYWRPPSPARPTLSEIFAVQPRDAAWAGFVLAQLNPAKPLLWVQERMAILESGRIHPPGLGLPNLIHVEARDTRTALWAMEEGVRCAGLSAVIGEIWGDPAALDFTATRRLAVAAERSGVAAFLIRLGGHANLSGARMRWRIASLPSLAHPFDARAPGPSVWDAELFRARGLPPGRWSIADEPQAGDADRLRLTAPPADRALGEVQRRSA
jgi:protein ImuA